MSVYVCVCARVTLFHRARMDSLEEFNDLVELR